MDENKLFKYRNIVFVSGFFIIGIMVNLISMIVGTHGKKGYEWISGLIFGLYILWAIVWRFIEQYLEWKQYH